MKKVFYIGMAFILCFASNANSENLLQPDILQLEDYQHYYKGNISEAATICQSKLAQIDQDKYPGEYLDTLSKLIDLYYQLGHLKKALILLQNAETVIINVQDRWRIIQYLNQYGMIYYAIGNQNKAIQLFKKAQEEALKTKHPILLAHVMNNIANCLILEKNYDEASIFYHACLDLLENTDDDDLKAIVLLNLFRLELTVADFNDNQDQAIAIAKQINQLPDSRQKANHLVTLSRVLENELVQTDFTNTQLFHLSYLALCDAKEIASQLDDFRILSCANGYLGRLYELTGQFEEAKKLTMQALFFSSQGNYPELQYRWQWQMGKLYMFCNDFNSAKKFFQMAIQTVDPIRLEFFSGFRNHEHAFNHHIKPLYTDLTELLINEAEKTSNKQIRQALLKEAITTMESLKTAELQDFFQDECTTQKMSTPVFEKAPNHTAIVYPIVLPEMLALLTILPDGIHLNKVIVDAPILHEIVRQYRKKLQDRTTHRFLSFSQQLYDWIIQPIENILMTQQIYTLIFAPDGVLRLIPLSTLHNGNQFLVENFAIGLIPAIGLTQTQAFNKTDIQILINGLSEARQGFSSLPSVTNEIQDIRKMFESDHVLTNNQYTIDNLTIEFSKNNYNIVHIATHGIFAGKKTDSFLLTYDGKLTMDQLEILVGQNHNRNQSVDLLTLSACQTALGNERAALGLAGVAVKAGVKSVVATLWYVDDEATSIAIREFYRQLMKPGISKAKALQNTQKKLIDNPRFWQPLYWAPFLLIGNWN
jgi:CHAT domain-containing protein